MSSARRLLSRGVIVALFGVVLAACAYQGAIDSPPTIKLTWFSYINGDDLRAACRPGSADRYRMVYNADYERQLRSYEIDAMPDGAGWLTTRVQGESLFDLGGLSLEDPLAPGRWATSHNTVPAERMAAIQGALAVSGAFAPPPTGLRVYSDQYYWVVTSCRDGVFAFNVWRYPSPRYDDLIFPELLFAEDQSGIAVDPPREVSPAARMKGEIRGDKANTIFQLHVGETGFKGHFKI